MVIPGGARHVIIFLKNGGLNGIITWMNRRAIGMSVPFRTTLALLKSLWPYSHSSPASPLRTTSPP